MSVSLPLGPLKRVSCRPGQRCRPSPEEHGGPGPQTEEMLGIKEFEENPRDLRDCSRALSKQAESGWRMT